MVISTKQRKGLLPGSRLMRTAAACMAMFSVGVLFRVWEMHTVSVLPEQRLKFTISARKSYDPGPSCSNPRSKGATVDHIPRRQISFNYVHRTHNMIGMATLARLPDGRWVAAWHESDGNEGMDGQRIMVTFSEDLEGSHWKQPLPAFEAVNSVREGPKGADWGPVLHCCNRHGKLLLFFSRSTLCWHQTKTTSQNSTTSLSYVDRTGQSRERFNLEEGSSHVLWTSGGSIMSSEWSEDGKVWSRPRVIYPQGLNEAPRMTGNNLIFTRSGLWMLPIWQEPPAGNTSCLGSISPEVGPASAVLVSTDEGQSWKVEEWVGESDRHLNAVEPSVVESTDNGKLLMVLGTNAGHIHITSSNDSGVTWDPVPAAIDLLDPGLKGTKPQALRLADGLLAVAYNNMHWQTLQLPQFKGAYTNIFVAASSDEGGFWTKIARLEDEVEEGLQMRSPTMVQAGCMLYVVYTRTYGREFLSEAQNKGAILGVKLAVIDLRDLN